MVNNMMLMLKNLLNFLLLTFSEIVEQVTKIPRVLKKYFINSFVNKKYVSNSGGIFSVRKGIPTGHAFTSLINSISTWVIWTIVIERCPYFADIKLNYSLQIQGDDVVISSDSQLEGRYKKEVEE